MAIAIRAMYEYGGLTMSLAAAAAADTT